MKKFSLLILSAALLASCGGASSTSKSSSVEPEQSSSSIAESSLPISIDSSKESSEPAETSEESSEPLESSEESSEPIESSEESSESLESSEDITEESVESSEESLESSEESLESSEESIKSSEELVESSEEDPKGKSVYNPFTVPEAYAIAEKLAPGEDAGEQYFIKGTVCGPIKWYNGRLSFDFYGIGIVDDQPVSYTLYVYNMNKEDNTNSYPEVGYNVSDGHEIIVAGTLKNYVDKSGNSKLEICYVKDVAQCYRAL